MAFQFVVETGAGLVNANAYCSTMEALTLIEEIPTMYRGTFEELPMEQQERFLTWGTRLLDDYLVWPEGTYKLSSAQALQFPRVGMVDQDGYLLPSTTVPLFMKRATVEMARQLLQVDVTKEAVGLGYDSITVGPITIDFAKGGAGGTSPRTIVRSVLAIVRPFGGVPRGSRMSIPLYRA